MAKQRAGRRRYGGPFLIPAGSNIGWKVCSVFPQIIEFQLESDSDTEGNSQIQERKSERANPIATP
jgi:hypothetical protein